MSTEGSTRQLWSAVRGGAGSLDSLGFIGSFCTRLPALRTLQDPRREPSCEGQAMKSLRRRRDNPCRNLRGGAPLSLLGPLIRGERGLNLKNRAAESKNASRNAGATGKATVLSRSNNFTRVIPCQDKNVEFPAGKAVETKTEYNSGGGANGRAECRFRKALDSVIIKGANADDSKENCFGLLTSRTLRKAPR